MMSLLLQAADTVQTTPSDLTTVIVTAISTIGVGGLAKLYQMYLKNRKEKRSDKKSDGLEFRKSLQTRVVELEGKIDMLQSKIESMITMYNDKVLLLSTEKAALEVEAGNLREENLELKAEVKSLRR